MSTKISKKKFTELVRNLLQKEIEEASTTTSAGIDGTGTGHYDTPKAFSTGSGHPTDGEVGGYKKVNEGGPGSGKPKDGSSKEKSKKDKEEMERKAKEQAKRDMEDEFDFDFDESVNEAKKYSDDWNLTKRVTSNFIKQNLKSVDNSIRKKDGEGLRFHLNQIIKGIQNAKRALKLESVNEDAKDVAKAKKLSQKIGNIEGKYRKAMYDLSDRLQADPKNHKLQDELIKSYTKHVTSFMKDMVKITKRVK